MVDEVIVDYRKRKTDLQPICINRECVEGVSCFKFQGVHMDADLQWSSNTVPSLQDLYSTRCLRRARSILRDSTHPGHRVLQRLPSGRRFRVLKARTNRLRQFLQQGHSPVKFKHLTQSCVVSTTG